MRWRLLLALLLGVGVLAAVLAQFDPATVTGAMARVGWSGFALVVAAGLAAEFVLSLGLVPLLPRRVPLAIVIASRQLRDSASDVLPITQLGGVVLAARALVLWGMAAPEAAAALIADLTAETFAQGLYVLLGVVTSLSLLSADAALSPYTGAMLGGALFLALGSVGFALVQIGGSRWALRLAARLFAGRLATAETFHQTLTAIYRRRGRLMLSILLQLAGWMASGLWLWAVLAAMSLPASLWTAIAIQALVEGLRSATVFIPAALGVQEAAYALLAPVFGLTPEIGLAVSLLRRARDLVVAVPVLLAWQAIEARRGFKAQSGKV